MKRLMQPLIVSLYLFLLIGFALHTSPVPAVFGKYTLKYFLFLLVLAYSIVPIMRVLNYVRQSSTVTFKRLKVKLSSKRKIVIFAVCTLIALLVMETVFRMYDIRPHSLPYTLDTDNFHPFLQARLTQKNNLEHPDFNINSSGFRGDEIEKEKPKDTYRIFFLGGSTILNNALAYNQTFEKILEDKLQEKYLNKKIEVQNAGMDGYTSLHSLIQYESYIRDFKPDLVVAWHGVNDMYNSCENTASTNGAYRNDYSHQLGAVSPLVKEYFMDKLSPVSLHLHLYTIELFKHFFTFNFYSDFNPRFNLKIAQYMNDHGMIKMHSKEITDFQSVPAYERNLQIFISLTQKDNVAIILGNQAYLYDTKFDKDHILPYWFVQNKCFDGSSYPDTQSLINGITKFNEVSRNVAEKNKISFIDLASQLPKTYEYFTDDVHYTSKASEKIADLLFSFIVDGHYIK